MQRSPVTGITLCVFDAYGTLYDVAKSVAKVLPDARGSELYALWRRKQLEYSWLRSLMGRHTDFWHVTGQSLDFAMASLGMEDPALRARLMEASYAPVTFADVLPTLEALHASGQRLAILSNGAPSMLTSANAAAKIDLLLDAVISAEEADVFKPHPTVYKLAADHFSAQPAEVAFISSNGWDAFGAAAFGFRSIWINRDGGPRDVLPATLDAEITALSELPALIQG